MSEESNYDALTFSNSTIQYIASRILEFPQDMPAHPEILSTNLYINDKQVTSANYNIQIIHGVDTSPDSYRIRLKKNAYSAGDYKVKIIFNYIGYVPYTPIDLKIANETEFMRLTSPNFNGMFEFKKTKLTDGLHYINIDCTYKPYSPYIKLNPDFSFMYGHDFNDSTGLICGGDFSIPVLNDAWRDYQLNNKNYQAVFNRQIQNLDVSQEIAREQMSFQNIVGAITGPVGGATGGALTGMKLGGGYGAAAGAAAGFIGGAALSIAGGVKNNEWLARQQGEAKSYAIDMYNYQLGNIKALPQSISKSDPLTFNNKIWPILEKFSCTDAEKEIIKNKIIYNSMAIMAIGKLNDYSSSSELDRVFVKGQLIRLDTIKDDFHIVDAIYQEVNKGFFVVQGE
jgi:hypothetical protein